jgi:ribosomal protein S18 acetylase RimI-like enzyme
MVSADFPFAVALTDTERWGFTVEDFERFLAISPGGCFVVEQGGHRRGMLTTCLYGEVGWIGNVIVSAASRGRGLGGALLDHAIAYLEGAGAAGVRLWAYENTVALYAKYGFADDGLRSRRWIGFGHTQHDGPAAKAPRGCAVFPLNALTLKDVFALDRAAFGADRARVLERVALDNPKGGLLARAADGSPVGFLLVKASPKGCEVGPWVVDAKEAPWAVPCLLETAVERLAGQSVELGVYASRADVVHLLAEHGFHGGFETIRMTRGRAPAEDVASVCAIGALEKG